MTEVDMNQYRALLMAKRRVLMSKSSSREDIRIVQSNEQIETVQLAGQREIAALSLERDTKRLVQVNAAIQRIDEGEFGTCLDCEEPIPAKRLAALPWAAYCLHCQELRDTQESADVYHPQLAA
jgi:DnaK suppressor protein